MQRQIPIRLLDNVIQDDKERGVFRVNRRVFTDEDLFELEREAIFERCWPTP